MREPDYVISNRRQTMSTVLAEVIEKAVAKGTFEAVARTAEAMGEEWAREVLKDPAVRAQMVALARDAFARAMADLGKVQPS
jgi:hypothetical protein